MPHFQGVQHNEEKRGGGETRGRRSDPSFEHLLIGRKVCKLGAFGSATLGTESTICSKSMKS